MDQKKMGVFIRTLRKEKNLTQEQLAELLNVTNRTVSRWETGFNIPDLDILIALADYFEVDIRELIDGEREVEEVNKVEHETLIMVADYSDHKEKMLIRKIHTTGVCGIFAWLVSFAFMMLFSDAAQGVAFLLISEALSALLYGCGMFCVKSNRTTSGYLSSLIGASVAIVVSNVSLLALFFGTGSYYNHGIVGAYYSLLIIISSFCISGIVTSIINNRRQRN